MIRLPFVLLLISALWLVPTTYSDSDETQDQLAYTPQLLEDLRDENNLVFLNFTADWCITCKVNEAVALKTSEVSKVLAEKNITYLEILILFSIIFQVSNKLSLLPKLPGKVIIGNR